MEEQRKRWEPRVMSVFKIPKCNAIINLIKIHLSRYPKYDCVRPEYLDALGGNQCDLQSQSYIAREFKTREFKICIQLVSDPFYFLLFGAIRQKIKSIRKNIHTDVIIVQSISGAVGFGLFEEIYRMAPFAWLRTNQWLRAFDADRRTHIGYRSTGWGNPFRDLRLALKAFLLWSAIRKQNANQHRLQWQGIEIADLVIDSYLRFRPSPRFHKDDVFVWKIIWQALRDIEKAEHYFSTVKPNLYLSSYTTYVEHGIALRVALKHSIPVWTFGSLQQFSKKIDASSPFHTPDCSAYKKTFDSLQNKEHLLTEARENLEKRLHGGIDKSTIYMRSSAYNTSGIEIALASDFAVVYLHDFYDSPHAWPDFIFDDFWEWLLFTVDVLSSSNTPFYIKAHPNQISMSDLAVKELKKIIPEEHWLPHGVNTIQLVEAGMICGVTAYGTVAHELAYFGILSISCARHPHHSFDFTRTATSLAEYKSFLEEHKAYVVDKKVMREQALAFYYMHNLYPHQSRSLVNKFHDLWENCHSNSSRQLDIARELYDAPEFDKFVSEKLLSSARLVG